MARPRMLASRVPLLPTQVMLLFLLLRVGFNPHSSSLIAVDYTAPAQPTDPTQKYDCNTYYGSGSGSGSGATAGYNYNYDTAAFDPATGTFVAPAGAYDPATATYVAPEAYDPATGTYAPTAAYDDATTAYTPGTTAPYDPATGYNYNNYDPNTAYAADTTVYPPNTTAVTTNGYDSNFYANYDPATYGSTGATAGYTAYDDTTATSTTAQSAVHATTGYDFSTEESSAQTAACIPSVPPYDDPFAPSSVPAASTPSVPLSDDPFVPSSEPFTLQDGPFDISPADTKTSVFAATKEDDLDLDLDELILGNKSTTIEQKSAVDSPMPPVATAPAATTIATVVSPVATISSSSKASPIGTEGGAKMDRMTESAAASDAPPMKMNTVTKSSPVDANETKSVTSTKVSPISADSPSNSGVTVDSNPTTTSNPYDSSVYGNATASLGEHTLVGAPTNAAPVDYGYSYEMDPSHGYGIASTTDPAHTDPATTSVQIAPAPYTDPNYGYTAPAQVSPAPHTDYGYMDAAQVGPASYMDYGYTASAQVIPAASTEVTSYVGYSDYSTEVTSHAEYHIRQTDQTGAVSVQSEHDFARDNATSRISPRSMHSQRTGQSRSTAPRQDPAPVSDDYGSSHPASQRYSGTPRFQTMDDEMSSVASMHSNMADLRQCPACQKFNDPDANFCSKCGTNISSVQTGSNVASTVVSRVQIPRPLTQLAEQMSAPARNGSPHSVQSYGGPVAGAYQHHQAPANQRLSAPLPNSKISVPVTPAVPEFNDPLKRTGCPLVSFGLGGMR